MINKTNYTQTEIGEIPEDWIISPLENYIDLNPKRSLSKKQKARCVAMADLQPFKKKIVNYTYKTYNGGSKFINGDTLLARITPCLENGKTALVDFLESSKVGFGSTEFIVLSKKDEKTDSQYVYYLSCSPRFREIAIKSMVGSSGRQRVQVDKLSDTLFAFPPLTEQKQITSILSSLDNKIGLSRKMNKTLEEIGKALFKHWFLDFEFPNEKGKPYRSSGGEMVDSELGEIPKGWEVKTINDVCKVRRGASPRPIQNFMNGTIPWVKIADATRADGQFIFDTREFVTEKGKQRSVLLKPGSLILSNSATCGIPIFLEIEGCIHDGWLYFNSYREVTKEYLFYCLDRLDAHLTQIADGSVQRNLNTGIVGSQKILIPTRDTLDDFTALVTLLFNKQRQNVLENQLLEEIRDSLLPRLMSGRLRAQFRSKYG